MTATLTPEHAEIFAVKLLRMARPGHAMFVIGATP